MTRRYYFRPFKPETIVATLHHLRCIIGRADDPGIEHVDALLRYLGTDPDTLPMPQKRPKHFARNELRRAILDALRSGPMTGAQIAEAVRGDLDPAAAYKRTYQALHKMKVNGMVRREGRVWLLSVRNVEPY